MSKQSFSFKALNNEIISFYDRCYPGENIELIKMDIESFTTVGKNTCFIHFESLSLILKKYIPSFFMEIKNIGI